MISRFLRTRIGISLLAAIMVVGLASAYKAMESRRAIARSSTGLIVEKIISDSLKASNQLDQTAPATSAAPSASDPSATSPSSDISYTATDRFSQEIFREYVAAKQSGQEISPDVSGRIAEAVLAQDYSAPKPVYSAIDMKTSSDSSKAAIKAYGNSLGTILTAAPAAKESELDIFTKIISEPVDSYVSELSALKKRYSAMKAKVLGLSAPLALASAQANIANSLDLFIGSIDGALAIDTDPIGALKQISQHQNGVALLSAQILAIQSYLKKQAVSFSPSESGYVLTR